MINRKSIWILTLFSLILVLSVYYITMPSEFLETASKNVDNSKQTKEVTSTKENEIISTLKVENEELKTINILKGKEEEISTKIKDELKLENFVKIKDDQVRVVVIKENQDAKLATDIMNLVQSNFDSKMYISIKFQK